MNIIGVTAFSKNILPPLLMGGTLISYAELIISGFNEDQTITSLFYLLVIFATAIAYYYFTRKKPYSSFDAAKSFRRDFTKLEPKHAWQRPEISIIRDMLAGERDKVRNKVIVITGPSGAGKSVIMDTYVVPNLQEPEWKVLKFLSTPSLPDDYEKRIKDELPGEADVILFPGGGEVSPLDYKLLVVFDQFERFPIAREKMTEGQVNQTEKFMRLIERGMKNEDIRFLFITRKEAYADLFHFLKEARISDHGTFVLGGIPRSDSAGRSTKEWDLLKDRYDTILPKSDSSDKPERYFTDYLFKEQALLPIQAQVIGWTLEASIVPRLQEGKEGKKYPDDLPDRRDDIVDKYFDLQIDDFLKHEENSLNHEKKRSLQVVDENVPIRVLLALALQRPIGRPLSDHEIAEITHMPLDYVRRCLQFFAQADVGIGDVGIGIVKRVGEERKYEIAHDYLANEFQRYSAAKLRGVDRDNIVYFSAIARSGPGGTLCPRTKGGAFRESTFNDYLNEFLFLCVLIIGCIRIFSPLYEPLVGVNLRVFNVHIGSFYETIENNLALKWSVLEVIDLFVVPITMSVFCGVLYAYSLYKNWLSSMKKGTVFSVALIIVSYMCGVAVLIYPYYWMSIAMIPVITYSVKLYQISTMEGLPEVSRKAVTSILRTCSFSSIFIFGVGLYFGNYLNNGITQGMDIPTIFAINFTACVAVCFYFLTGWIITVSPNAATEMLGLLDRGTVSKPNDTRDLTAG